MVWGGCGSRASLDGLKGPPAAPDRPPVQGPPVEQGEHVELRRGHHGAGPPAAAAAAAAALLAGGEGEV